MNAGCESIRNVDRDASTHPEEIGNHSSVLRGYIILQQFRLGSVSRDEGKYPETLGVIESGETLGVYVTIRGHGPSR
jgi:hypothetical protein